MINFDIGNILKIEGIKCTIIGKIIYKNTKDSNKWTDYRLQTKEGEQWLSVDDICKEYSISRPSYLQNGQIPNEWKKVDEGNQVVVYADGDVDVDSGEYSEFVEYEDEEGKKTFSLEIWEDGTEISEGHYVEEEDIILLKEQSHKGILEKIPWGLILAAIIFLGAPIFDLLGPKIDDVFGLTPTIEEHLKNGPNYEYVTSLTGENKEKANIYKETDTNGAGTDSEIKKVTTDLIDAINGKTESVTDNGLSGANSSTSILTKKEYCIVYHPEDKPSETYIQVSNREYAYGTKAKPYHSNYNTFLWYTGNYHKYAYPTDSKKFKSESPYRTYKGPIVQDMGNGYFDTYSSSVRQSSTSSRSSSGGGLSSGK